MEQEFVVVGAGPAGLQMAHHLRKAGRSHRILEAGNCPGAFYTRFPRHRTLLSINKRHNWFTEDEFNLRHDWNSLLTSDASLRFTSYTEDLYPQADTLVKYLGDCAEKLGLNVECNTRVVRVQRSRSGGFIVHTSRGETLECRTLLFATGAVKPWLPSDIEGLEHVVGYEDHSLDAASYRNKRVAIIGAGNSAFEVANHVASEAAIVHLFVRRPVRHAWETHYPGDLRSLNNTILDMYQLKSLHATVGFQLKKVSRRPDGTLSVQVEEEYPHWDPPSVGRVSMVYDHVIRCSGWKYIEEEIFDEDCRPEIIAGGKYPKLGADWQTSVPGLYFLGTNMQARDRKAASSFIHGFRYNVRTLFNLLEERTFGVPYPECTFKVDSHENVGELANWIVNRVSIVSSLYQQFGVLCDAIRIEGGSARYQQDLPAAYVLERAAESKADAWVLLTMEYGFHKYEGKRSTLEFIHPADPRKPDCSAFLHPVLRLYVDGVLKEELHLGESLVVRYDHYDYEENHVGSHVNRLRNFLAGVMGLSSGTFFEGAYAPDIESKVLRPLAASQG